MFLSSFTVILMVDFCLVYTATGQQYNLTGSSTFAVLGEAFTWTCDMFIPTGQTISAIRFSRNDVACGIVIKTNGSCIVYNSDPIYTYGCPSNGSYTLTIPAENMTEYEQSSVWNCAYFALDSIKSPDATLNIAIDVQNVTIIPTGNPLILREGTKVHVKCVVNRNAVPNPIINWYIGSTDITNRTDTDTSSITVTGNRMDNTETLQCRATNNNKPPRITATTLDIEFPPHVLSFNQQNGEEGRSLSVTCKVMDGNPSSTTVFWTKVYNLAFRQHGRILQIPNIQRNSSGTYSCTAENTYSNGEKGTHSQDVIVDVLYKPGIEEQPRTIVNETQRVVLRRQIDSNPLSNISWYDGSLLLKTQAWVNIATLVIQNASCTDTKNFTLVANNNVERNVTVDVELIVNCKPMVGDTNISVGATYSTGIDFSTTVIAYPQPQYELQYGDGTRNSLMTDNMLWNAVNNFTIHFNKMVVKPCDFGKYHLKITNLFGVATVFISVFQQGKPNSPGNVKITCDVSDARIQWKSSFNGRDSQSFIVVFFNSQQGTHSSKSFPDRGEEKVHEAYIQNLLPSMPYMFYVTAQNSYGNSSSEIVSCTTLKETSDLTGVVAGSLGGTLTLITIVLFIGLLVHRRYACSINFEKRYINNTKNKEETQYTTMADRDQYERTFNDGLANSENMNQYESIKELVEDTGKAYETLQIHNSDDTDSKHQQIMLETPVSPEQSNDESLILKKTSEYANTSFMP